MGPAMVYAEAIGLVSSVVDVLVKENLTEIASSPGDVIRQVILLISNTQLLLDYSH